MQESFTVKGINSENCAEELESILSTLTGVKEVTTNSSSKKVKVIAKFDDSKVKLADLENEVRAAGYEVS